MFRENAGALPVIGKVIRGAHAGRLLYYLYGPGRANEHTDPHLVAAFGDPAELEPERRPGGAPDLRRLTGLLNQPLAALAGAGYEKPVWHCAVRAAPEDPVLTDGQWARIAGRIMHRTGLAPEGDDLGVRWVAVRHAGDHIHIVATLARQDGARPKLWRDFCQVRDACLEAERELGLRRTAPADRTAARRATRAETEQAARRGWAEPARLTLRREVSVAAAAAGTEQEFFAALERGGVLVRLRRSTVNPGEVTGYAVGLPAHTAKHGGPIWYSGGKLAADLTLPKLRARWTTQADGAPGGAGLSAGAARAVLRGKVSAAASGAVDEAGFFARLREAGVMVRLRFSELDPGQVTGYSVALPGCTAPDGTPLWHGGGRLAAGLTLPRLRARWHQSRATGAEQGGAFRLTAPEREEIYAHAARQASAAAEHIRRCAATDPRAAADAAWAAADTLHVAGRALGSRTLRRAADAYDRAARAPHGRIPPRTRAGNQLRTAARILALAGDTTGADSTAAVMTLIANLITLAAAVAELRQAQQHAAQSAAARAAAGHLHTAMNGARRPARPHTARPGSAPNAARMARGDFPAQPRPARDAMPGGPGNQASGPAVHPNPARPARPARGRRAGPAP